CNPGCSLKSNSASSQMTNKRCSTSSSRPVILRCIVRLLSCCAVPPRAVSVRCCLCMHAGVGVTLHNGVLNFVRCHVGDCEPHEVEDGERADCEHLRFRLWRRIELESPAVRNLS